MEVPLVSSGRVSKVAMYGSIVLEYRIFPLIEKLTLHWLERKDSYTWNYYSLNIQTNSEKGILPSLLFFIAPFMCIFLYNPATGEFFYILWSYKILELERLEAKL